ncbi:MAG: flagellar protein FlaG [Firmicutes bacterium]|mgnify:CR=1 FL=1|nr:flagellar protein FlaG [Bacillota bacterium]
MAIKGVSSIGGRQSDYTADMVRGQEGKQPGGDIAKPHTSGAPGRDISQKALPGEFSTDDLSEVVEDLNETVDVFNKGLHFRVHEETERIVVEVVDKDTGDVIREIPPEYILDLMAKIDALFGVFVDEKI